MKCAPCLIKAASIEDRNARILAISECPAPDTQIGGTLVCSKCAVAASRAPGAARDPALRAVRPTLRAARPAS